MFVYNWWTVASGVAIRFNPNFLKSFNRVLRFGVVLPDSMRATDECGRPHSSARSL